jgi:ABC-type molybdate transport system substrate-binding protein
MTKPLRAASLVIATLLCTGPAQAQTPAHVTLFASGTLHAAFAEIAKTFTQKTGIIVDQTYGASPQLSRRIEDGESVDVFASADTASPERLQRTGRSGAVTIFAHNRMCLLVKPPVAGTRAADELMLDPAVRLITAVPVLDSAGDYAEATFAKLDARRPGSKARLDAKALRLFGNRDVAIPAGADPGAYLLLTANRGDAFLGWCTAAAISAASNPAALRSLPLPPDITVDANYGITLRNAAPVEAAVLRGYIVSPAGQAILERYGFAGV